ncbi:non-heme iron oxygenase ferredoxin subunit [Quadrisphaera sp. GCM10027208]|uniref:non-heme iron oxygenase ferredoxin subunit n=1 Tax=Quadrisphaera sp. GCM10027208 TaxID=3273423 RepID=UPI0036236E30|nr:non-heme iron oxygenase ferredoxin subunit [Kineosporiaceae bacterium SCSIO 59966]
MSAQRVCSVTDVPADTNVLRVEVPGPAGTVPVAVVRDEHGDLHAVSDICSHQDVSLSEGEVDDCTIECWLHGSRFDLRTGRPTALPATRPIPVYRLTVEGEDVLVDVTAPLGADAAESATSKER